MGAILANTALCQNQGDWKNENLAPTPVVIETPPDLVLHKHHQGGTLHWTLEEPGNGQGEDIVNGMRIQATPRIQALYGKPASEAILPVIRAIKPLGTVMSSRQEAEGDETLLEVVIQGNGAKKGHKTIYQLRWNNVGDYTTVTSGNAAPERWDELKPLFDLVNRIPAANLADISGESLELLIHKNSDPGPIIQGLQLKSGITYKSVVADPGRNGLEPPVLINREWPQGLKDDKGNPVKGTFMVMAVINPGGYFIHPTIVNLGNKQEGPPSLYNEVLNRWRARPATVSGKPENIFVMYHRSYGMDNHSGQSPVMFHNMDTLKETGLAMPTLATYLKEVSARADLLLDQETTPDNITVNIILDSSGSRKVWAEDSQGTSLPELTAVLTSIPSPTFPEGKVGVGFRGRILQHPPAPKEGISQAWRNAGAVATPFDQETLETIWKKL